jgi:Xaa-Pro aminopeptidase
MDAKKLDLIVISSPNNVYYFSGFQTNRPILAEVFSMTVPGYLLATKNEDPVLMVGERDRAAAAATFGGQLLTYRNYNLRERMIAYPDFVADEIKKVVSNRVNARRIGVETWQIPSTIVSALNGAGTDWLDLSPDILLMRGVKDPDEIEALRMSCRLNDFAYSVARERSIAGNSELDVYAAIQHELTRKVGS